MVKIPIILRFKLLSGYEERFGIVYFSYVCWDSTRYPVIIQILNYLEKNEVPIVTRISLFQH